MAKKARIGFVGVGTMGQCAHLRNYPSIDNCEVVAIAEIRQNTARRVAERYGVPNVYPNHEEMLKAERLDGIVASQPFNRHAQLIPDLLKSGIPVFTEKPLAGCIECGKKVVDAVKENDTWMMIGYHKRSDPASMYAKREVEHLQDNRELGAMTYIRSLMPAGDWIGNGFLDLIKEEEGELPGLEFDPPATDMSEEIYDSYMSFVNYYIHQVNLLRYFLGEDYHATYAEPSGVLFAGKSDSGIPVTIEMSPYKTSIDWQEHILICFEKGYIRVDLPSPLASNRPGRVEIFRDSGGTPETIVPSLPWVHAMRQQAINFVAAVNGERDTMCNADQALKDLMVAREYINLKTGE